MPLELPEIFVVTRQDHCALAVALFERAAIAFHGTVEIIEFRILVIGQGICRGGLRFSLGANDLGILAAASLDRFGLGLSLGLPPGVRGFAGVARGATGRES